MIDDSLSCPSCCASKYSNPQLKLMVNVCGHSLCENCVEVLFVRGSGLCVQCKTPIRKNNFRYQLFEDPLVQKEVEIRKKILSDFNKREDDFDSMEEYDLYLEMVEEIIYNLTNNINVEETKRYIEVYKKDNKDLIKRNRLRPTSSMAFYEAELEHEALIRERREKEEREEVSEAKRSRLERQTRMVEDILPGKAENSTGHKYDAIQKPPPTACQPAAAPSSSIPVPPSEGLPSRSLGAPSTHFSSTQAPASALSFRNRLSADRKLIPPSSGGAGLMAPPSMVQMAPPTGTLTGSWFTGLPTRRLPLPPSMVAQRKQEDTVVLTKPDQLRKSSQPTVRTGSQPTPFIYKPYIVEYCGPIPPVAEDHPRWSDLLITYEGSIIQLLLVSIAGDVKPSIAGTSFEEGDVKEPVTSNDGTFAYKKELETTVKHEPGDINPTFGAVDEVDTRGTYPKQDVSSPLPIGMSHKLVSGACGISPAVFLRRCLDESRYGLFM